jgi:hypothetical protein
MTAEPEIEEQTTHCLAKTPMNGLDRKVPHLFEKPRIILLANQLHDPGASRKHERTPMPLVARIQMTKKARVRKDRDPQDFVSPNCSAGAGERPAQVETGKADEFGKAVHEGRMLCDQGQGADCAFSATLSAEGSHRRVLDSTKELLPRRPRGRLELQHYEQRLQEIRKERKAETKQVERLSAILMKRGFRRSQELPSRVA